MYAPLGGRPVPISGVTCEASSNNWTYDLHDHTVRPTTRTSLIGQPIDVKVAPTAAECATSDTYVTLVATDRFPGVDSNTIIFSPDDGRFEAQGIRLTGVTVAWTSGGQSGFDVCRTPTKVTGKNIEHCSWSVGRNASADPKLTQFRWLPNGARLEESAIFYDERGRRLGPESFIVVPARFELTRLVPTDAAVDLATGQGEVPLVHPEAVGSAECEAPITCEMVDGRLVVRGASRLVHDIDVTLRLVPHVWLLQKNLRETQISVKLPVMHCPMSIVSGPAIRNNDDAKVVIKLSGRCARDIESLRFVTRDGTLKVLQILKEDDASYALLVLGAVHGDSLTINAIWGEDDIALAIVYVPLKSAPQVRTTLEMIGYRQNINFIPNNIWTRVHVSSAGEGQYFVPLPVEGIYSVRPNPNAPSDIQAELHAAGLVSLRFGLRADTVPAGLDQADLAVITEPLQRSTAEANIPRSIDSGEPLVEVLCGGGNQPLKQLEIGVTFYLSFDLRDTCRVVFHRERLLPTYGTQKLNFEVDVVRPDESTRSEAHISETISMRAGKEPRVAWIKGIKNPFDRVRVRVSHVGDENHYIGGGELTDLPVAQWSAVMGTSRVRLYGTSAIPTGLYRFGGSENASGVLALNFGVISRLAVLDKEGHEFPVAFETGVLVFGVESGDESLFQVGVVAGLGLAVPIANRGEISQASINIHAWGEVNVSDPSSRFAFIFGPSITIGNVGANF